MFSLILLDLEPVLQAVIPKVIQDRGEEQEVRQKTKQCFGTHTDMRDGESSASKNMVPYLIIKI